MTQQTRHIPDLSEYKLQRDDLTFLKWPTAISLALILLILLIFGVTTFNVVGSTFVLLVLLAFYYSNYTRHCLSCGDKMTKDNSHGLICENQYCTKCKTRVDIKVKNPRGRQ